MAEFRKAGDKKSNDYHLWEGAKRHAIRLAGAFRRVKGKLGLRKTADHRPGILPNSALVADGQ